jgi:hypothetical protein
LESRDASSPDSRNVKSRKRFMHKHVVSAGGHTIEELKRRVRADKLLFGVSGIATWRVEMPHLQIHEMRNRESFMHKHLVIAMVI